ncbi:hypothetical protein B566_EDAN015716 [Ephemera danica]|nr:hypothetical protein B566_EDAN015716 [Ephemera danica]
MICNLHVPSSEQVAYLIEVRLKDLILSETCVVVGLVWSARMADDEVCAILLDWNMANLQEFENRPQLQPDNAVLNELPIEDNVQQELNNVLYVPKMPWTTEEALIFCLKEGKYFVTTKKYKKLDDTMRKKLCRVIMDKVAWEDMEYELYYSPAVKHQKHSGKRQKLYVGPKGKLCSRYKKARSKLVKEGLRKRRRRVRRKTGENQNAGPSTDSESENNPNENPEGGDTVDDENLDLIWLQHNISPDAEVIRRWNLTSKLRSAAANSTIRSEFEKYPALKGEQGYSLIDVDFKNLYRGKEDKLFILWNTIQEKLIEKAATKRLAGELRELYEIAKEVDAPAEQKCLLSFLLVPILCPTSRNHTLNDKSKWKPSIAEASRAFILHVQDAADIEEAGAKRRQECQEKGITLQPYVLIVGPTLSNIISRYVIIENQCYRVESIVKAVDIAFKAAFVFNAKYQYECAHVWQFIQYKIFEIRTKSDEYFGCVQSLICDLK